MIRSWRWQISACRKNAPRISSEICPANRRQGIRNAVVGRIAVASKDTSVFRISGVASDLEKWSNEHPFADCKAGPQVRRGSLGTVRRKGTALTGTNLPSDGTQCRRDNAGGSASLVGTCPRGGRPQKSMRDAYAREWCPSAVSIRDHGISHAATQARRTREGAASIRMSGTANRGWQKCQPHFLGAMVSARSYQASLIHSPGPVHRRY